MSCDSSDDEKCSQSVAKAFEENLEVHTSDEFSESGIEEYGVDANNMPQDECQWFCCVCGENYQNSKPGEKWVRCTCKRCVNCIPPKGSACSQNFCQNWAHNLCTDNPVEFMCCECG